MLVLLLCKKTNVGTLSVVHDDLPQSYPHVQTTGEVLGSHSNNNIHARAQKATEDIFLLLLYSTAKLFPLSTVEICVGHKVHSYDHGYKQLHAVVKLVQFESKHQSKVHIDRTIHSTL